MPSFIVKSRIEGPATEQTIDADTREHAVDQVVKAAPQDGSEVDILNVEEVIEPASAPPGDAPTEQSAEQPTEQPAY